MLNAGKATCAACGAEDVRVVVIAVYREAGASGEAETHDARLTRNGWTAPVMIDPAE